MKFFRFFLFYFALGLSTLPLYAFGAPLVVINEIAWMGSTVSASHEWIELSNSGDAPADLSGWTLSAADGTPEILLEGTISAGGYFLLERTSDESVPAIAADQIYTGALGNSGETVTLVDASGSVRDMVAGGENWQNLGGDNTTKQSAQRTSLNNTWITATATPKAQNVSAGEVAGASTENNEGGAQNESVSAPTTGASGSGQTSSTAAPASVYPRSTISVFAGEDMRVFSGFPAGFSGSAKGLYDESLEYAIYRWNFGDGATGEGKSISHTYPFAGEYVVVLEAIWGTHKKTDRMIVTVTRPDVAIGRVVTGADGFVEMSNRGGSEINLSGWSVRASDSSAKFVFPENTILLPRKSAVFPNSLTRLTGDGVIELASPSGMLIASYGKETFIPASSVPAVVVAPSRVTEKTPKQLAPPTLVATAAPLPVRDVTAPPESIAESAPAISGAAATILWERTPDVSGGGQLFSVYMKWFFLLIGIILTALAGIIIARSRVSEDMIANEYAIIEDIIESEIKE